MLGIRPSSDQEFLEHSMKTDVNVQTYTAYGTLAKNHVGVKYQKVVAPRSLPAFFL
eukprot:evm.model.NODE_1885_length_1660_cov_79.406021.1